MRTTVPSSEPSSSLDFSLPLDPSHTLSSPHSLALSMLQPAVSPPSAARFRCIRFRFRRIGAHMCERVPPRARPTSSHNSLVPVVISFSRSHEGHARVEEQEASNPCNRARTLSHRREPALSYDFAQCRGGRKKKRRKRENARFRSNKYARCDASLVCTYILIYMYINTYYVSSQNSTSK